MNKNNKSKIIGISVAALIVLAITVVLASNKKEINSKATEASKVTSITIPVKVSTVESKSEDNSYITTGTFEARKELPLTAEIQGSITRLNVREGDRVSAGQVIAAIDPTAIQSNLNTARASYNKAVKDAERYERLAKAGAISQKQYEDIKLNVDNASANLAAVQQQMNYSIIRSPMNGVINELKIETGSFATIGMKIGSVVDVSRLKMVVKVQEEEIIKLRKGQDVKILTDVYPEHPFEGKISLIGVTANEARKYDVEVEVPVDNKYLLKAGMFGTVYLNNITDQNKPELFIPRKAIIGSIKEPQVFVAADNKVTLKNIQVRNISGDEVIVLNGLDAGDKVVVSGQINLKTGDNIMIID